MIEKKLKKKVNKRLTGLVKYASKILRRDRAEDIHEMRKSYKKLRALIRLMQIKQDEKSPLKDFKQVYKTAGEVRDRQLYRLFIMPYFERAGLHGGRYMHYLDKQINKHKKKLQKKLGKYKLGKLEDKVEGFVPGKLEAEKLNTYLDNKLGELEKLMDKKQKNKELHTMRKYLKDIRYNGKDIDAKKLSLIDDHEEDIKILTDLLGDLNDTVTWLALVKKAPLASLPKKEQNLLKAIKIELKKERYRQKEVIKGQVGIFRHVTLPQIAV